MRRLLLSLLLVATSLVSYAASLTPLQRTAKSEILSTLKRYDTNAYSMDDETLVFKYKDIQYRVSISSLNEKTLYLCLSAGFKLGEEYDSEIATLAALRAASEKPVCSMAYGGLLVFSCETYARDAKSFVSVFSEMLWALDSSVKSFQEEYDKAKAEFAPVRMDDILKVYQEYIYPYYIYSGDSKLYIKSVQIHSDYTVLDMISYNGKKWQYCYIDRNTYLQANGRKYKLQKIEGISYAPTPTYYPNYTSGNDVCLNFKLYFPALPEGTSSFDFYEDIEDGWQIRGIELEDGKVVNVYGEQLQTEVHTWKCKTIELRSEQTILTKVVTPKENGTYMYSSKSQFIEDADTGRKYYLQNSSIGFEGCPAISNNKQPITFYEVYPALPASVKRINISSGYGYYVKNLKIRN